jgi:hypothetical protein
MKRQSIIFPKVGNTQNECEDYLMADEQNMRFAVSDGASDSVFSGLWARCLVDTFSQYGNLTGNPDEIINKIYRNSINLWHDKIEWNNLKWNVKNKSVLGSYATFIGMEIKKTVEELQSELYSRGRQLRIHKNKQAAGELSHKGCVRLRSPPGSALEWPW